MVTPAFQRCADALGTVRIRFSADWQTLDPVFAKRVAHVKFDKNVRRSTDDYELRKYRKARKQGIKIGKANGIKIGEANTAMRMIQSGEFSESQIITATCLSASELAQLREKDTQPTNC